MHSNEIGRARRAREGSWWLACIAALASCGESTSTPAEAAGANAGADAAVRADAAPPLIDVTQPSATDSTVGCPTTTDSPGALHDAALHALVPADTSSIGPCAASSCHGSIVPKDGLQLTADRTDLRAALVGKASCEMPTWSLVDGSAGDAALARSWLWQKLVAPAQPTGSLVPQAGWTAADGCEQPDGAPFGMRMPFSGTDTELSDDRLLAVRRWICAGAPGPTP